MIKEVAKEVLEDEVRYRIRKVADKKRIGMGRGSKLADFIYHAANKGR